MANNLKPQSKEPSVDQDLKNIYTDPQSGRLEDVSRLDIKNNNPLRIVFYILVGLVILLGIIFWYVIFGSPQTGEFSGKSVDIKITSDLNIASGDEIRYIIEYSSKDKFDLLNTELILKYPDGFTFSSAEPEPANQYNNIWKLGTLSKDQPGKIEVTGKLIGELGALKTLDVTISYQPQNFSSTFKENHSFTSQITSSILGLSIQGPTQALPDKEVIFTIDYENTSDRDLNNIQVIAAYPDNFEFLSSEPEVNPPSFESGENVLREDEIDNIWFSDVLESNESKKITIRGRFDPDGDKSFSRILVQVGFIETEGEFSVQLEEEHEIQITKSNLRIDMFINGASQDSSVNFEDTLNYIIVFKNLGQETLKDFRIVASLESDILDWDTLLDKNLGKVQGGQITWDEDSFASFSQINPLDEGTIEFSIKVKDADTTGTQNNFSVKSSAQAIIGQIDDVLADVSVKTNEIVHAINTALNLAVEARYFNNDNIAVGSGPLPPVVGKKTNFRIYWYLSNSIHEVGNVVVTTKLPNGTRWADKTQSSIGLLSYDEDKNVVSWRIPTIVAKKSFNDIAAWFDVYVIPTSDQVGKLLLLTTETNLTAQDTITDSSIVLLERSLTSNIENDPFGSGRGLVEEE